MSCYDGIITHNQISNRLDYVLINKEKIHKTYLNQSLLKRAILFQASRRTGKTFTGGIKIA